MGCGTGWAIVVVVWWALLAGAFACLLERSIVDAYAVPGVCSRRRLIVGDWVLADVVPGTVPPPVASSPSSGCPVRPSHSSEAATAVPLPLDQPLLAAPRGCLISRVPSLILRFSLPPLRAANPLRSVVLGFLCLSRFVRILVLFALLGAVCSCPSYLLPNAATSPCAPYSLPAAM